MTTNTTRTIDLTPTFEQAVQMCLVLLENGTETGKREAADELLRYGRELDRLKAAKEAAAGPVSGSPEWTNADRAGLLPGFLSFDDPRPAKDQINDAYAHGGGWHRFEGFELHDWPYVGEASLIYPGDPAMREIARTRLRDEVVILFQSDWVAIVQRDGSFETARID